MKYLTLLLTLLPVIALVVTDYKTKAEDIIVSDDNESGGPTFSSEDNLPPPTFRIDQSGMDGILNCTDSGGCEWQLMAPTGYVIDIDVETFEFSGCTDDAVYVGDGNENNTVPIGTYDCDNSPTLVRSNSKAVFVNVTKSNPANKFFATWKALPAPECCSKIYVNASSSAYISTYASYNVYLGEYSTSNEKTTAYGIDYPVYRTVADSDIWLARTHIEEYTYTPWIMEDEGFDFPGANSGDMYYGPPSASCAEHLAAKEYQDNDIFIQAIEYNDIIFECLSTCNSSGPTGPSETSSDFDGTNTFNTIVTFTCMEDEAVKFYSKCQSDGAWSSISGECPQEEVMASEGNNLMDEDSPCAYFTSPNWPSNYGPSSDIYWDFFSQVSGSCSSPKLQVEFTKPFSIIGKLNCKRQDRLIIYRKNRKPRRICDYFVKKAVPSMRTYSFEHSQYVSFRFRSDQRRSAEGFKATVCVKCS